MSPLSHHHSTTRPHPERSESGVILITVAVSLLAVLIMGAFVASGSQAYSQRRNAQNAADAAAMAGARALNAALFENGVAPGSVDAAVQESAVDDNKGFDYECYLVLHDGTRMQDALTTDDIECSNTAVLTHWRNYLSAEAPTWAQPVGVEVVVADRMPTLFGGVEGLSETVTARASAIATIQSINQIGSPFVFCASPAYRGTPGQANPIDILRRHSTNPNGTDFVFNADGTVSIDPVKATSVGTFPLQHSQNNACGAGSQFKAKIVSDHAYTIPGWVQTDTGNGFEADYVTQVLTANPCPDPFPTGETALNCDMVIPIAIEGDSSNRQVRVVAAGVFHVTGNGNGNPKYSARWLGEVTQVAGGYSSAAPPGATSLRVIRLIK